jgi:hypothetical protein
LVEGADRAFGRTLSHFNFSLPALAGNRILKSLEDRRAGLVSYDADTGLDGVKKNAIQITSSNPVFAGWCWRPNSAAKKQHPSILLDYVTRPSLVRGEAQELTKVFP